MAINKPRDLSSWPGFAIDTLKLETCHLNFLDLLPHPQPAPQQD